MSPQSTGRPALRIGFQFGLILGILAIVFTVISGLARANSMAGVAGILSIVDWVLTIVLYIWAGFRASAVTGRVSTGLLAGLWAGLFNSVLAGIATVVEATLTADSVRSTYQQVINQASQGSGSTLTITSGQVIALAASGSVLLVIGALILGLALGAIGGAFGKSRAPLPANPYQEAMYPGAPYPGMPYPGMPYPGMPYQGAPYPTPAAPYQQPGPQYPDYPPTQQPPNA